MEGALYMGLSMRLSTIYLCITITCTLPVHYLYITCTLPVHSLPVHYLYIIYLNLGVGWLERACELHIQPGILVSCTGDTVCYPSAV